MVSKLNYQFGEPQRGDIVVFVSPFNDEFDQETFLERVVRHIVEAVGIRTASADDLIKRIVGLPGDEIVIREGKLYRQRGRGERALSAGARGHARLRTGDRG